MANEIVLKPGNIALQVVIGRNNHIYRKIVDMPILPVGSVVQFTDEIIDSLHIHGYWWMDGLTIAWLSSFRRLYDSSSSSYGFDTVPKYHSLLAQDFECFHISFKSNFTSEGFRFTGRRTETFP